MSLFNAEFPNTGLSRLEGIAGRWKVNKSLDTAISDIRDLERGLGPIGIWSARYDSTTFSFSYLHNYDEIFRPLKYVYMDLLSPSRIRVAKTRDIVLYSTMHVESCLKALCRHNHLEQRLFEKRPIGALTRLCRGVLPKELNSSLDYLSQDANFVSEAFIDEVENQWKEWVNPSNDAKHAYGDIPTSLFTPEDAIGLYLCARKIGFSLLKLVDVEARIEQEFREGGPFTDFIISL